MNLTDEEVDDICSGYTQNAAKVRYLRSLGLSVHIKPNGRPLVNRKHYENVMGAGNLAKANSDLQPLWGVH